MNVLIVGAGAVGQVLGAHFQKGGERVAVLVKEKHAEEARRGFTLKALHKKGATLSFTPEVVTSHAGGRWDLIVLCMSSTALKSGTWLDELARAEGTFVCIQPGLEDPAYVAARVGGERVAWGMFPLIAFAADGAMDWYLPPLGKLPFSGARAKEVVESLNRGGLPSRVDRDVPSAIAFSGPLLEMFIVALELAGWKLKSIQLRDAFAGLREALAVIARQRGSRAPLMLRLLRPWMLRLALPILKFAPFDVEGYLQRHFTKVGDQTVAGLDTLIGHAQKYQLPAAALEGLRGRLLQARAA
jgi:2-dehydropantoate 2-reductase